MKGELGHKLGIDVNILNVDSDLGVNVGRKVGLDNLAIGVVVGFDVGNDVGIDIGIDIGLDVAIHVSGRC